MNLWHQKVRPVLILIVYLDLKYQRIEEIYPDLIILIAILMTIL